VGFPESGRLSIGNEVIGYTGRTPTTFVGLTRRLYHTSAADLEYVNDELRREYLERTSDNAFIETRGISMLRKMNALYSDAPPSIAQGTQVSSFEHRLIAEDQRRPLPENSPFLQPDFNGYPDSPLIWQNRTDLYVAVVRQPDRPWLRAIAETWELIPGENHWETFGYHLFRDAEQITDQPVRPGTTFSLPGAGRYTAVAVELSGLRSEPSAPFDASAPGALTIRSDKPADFSWTEDRWVVDGQSAVRDEAVQATAAFREIVHHYEGVIHREWYEDGQLVRRHDLNATGEGTRRLFHEDGRLQRREYYNREGQQVTTEHFDTDGFITETIQFRYPNGEREEYYHFWYDKGTPIKYVGHNVRHAASQGSGTYEKQDNRWVKLSDL